MKKPVVGQCQHGINAVLCNECQPLQKPALSPSPQPEEAVRPEAIEVVQLAQAWIAARNVGSSAFLAGSEASEAAAKRFAEYIVRSAPPRESGEAARPLDLDAEQDARIRCLDPACGSILACCLCGKEWSLAALVRRTDAPEVTE